jgi:hypothetical protein
MGRSASYTIAYEATGGEQVDLCRIIFGGDGSYYVTAPYHPAKRALAGIYEVNYAAKLNILSLIDAVELSVFDDDERRLKIAHHVDGFLQFSGEGIRSGREENGDPKGIGLMSWPLNNPTSGPSFQLGFSDPVACGRASKGKPGTIMFAERDIEHMRRSMIGLTVVGHYLPGRWREFVYRDLNGAYWVDLVHPNGQAIKHLRVILASVDAGYAGLIGLEAMPISLDGTAEPPSFFLSTATGNLRRNEAGDLLGDQLMCVYPQPDLKSARAQSLNYTLPAPPPSAPPGTTAIMPDGELNLGADSDPSPPRA